jgi:hypothetical protein
MSPLNFFSTDRIVVRTAPDGKVTEFTIGNESQGRYHYDLQRQGYTYVPKRVVHQGPPESTCEACSG